MLNGIPTARFTASNGLEPGDYTLRETSAPDGYEIAEDVKFTVKATGDVQKVEMKDKATPETPEPYSDVQIAIAPVAFAA